MADLIDRQAALDALIEKGQRSKRYRIGEFWELNFDEIREAMATVPSAQPEPRWIPCSERLPEHPENGDYYLVTIQCEHYDGWDDYVTGFAEWTKHGWDDLSYIGQIKVVAWMPLPKPYERSEDGSQD